MGVVEGSAQTSSTTQKKRTASGAYILFIAGLIAGLLLRISLASNAHTPGHGDPVFYYNLAENIVDGRGFVIDYVVYYFDGLAPIPHYSNDFWNPLTSIILSIPMLIFGKSIFHALLASMAAGFIIPIIGFLAAKRYSDSDWVAAMAGVLICFAPIQVWGSVATDSNIFFGAFGALALYAIMLANKEPKYFLLAAVCIGLAQLTRNDGLLLLVALATGIFLSKIGIRAKVYFSLGALAIYGLVLSPLMIKNYTVFHSPFPDGPSKTMFLTTYEDFHAYGKPLDFSTYRQWGIQAILKNKLHAARENLSQVEAFLLLPFAVLVIAGLAYLGFAKDRKAKLSLLLPGLTFAIAEYLFYTLIATFSGPGSLPKSLAILIPFLYIPFSDLLERLLKLPIAIAIVCIALSLYSGDQSYQMIHTSINYYNKMYETYGKIKLIITDQALLNGQRPDNVVVMTRDPWDVHEGTGFKAVMIPNNDLETIYLVAAYYQADYILLPAPRNALNPIYSGKKADPRFQLLTEIENTPYKIFKIISNQ